MHWQAEQNIYFFFKVIKLAGVHISLKFPCSVCAPVLTSIKTLVTPTTYISLETFPFSFSFLPNGVG